jgi:hypothetical protein
MRYVVCSIVALCSALAVAEAEAAPARISEATLRERLAGVEVRPSPHRAGWLTIETWRKPEVQLREGGFRLVLEWNGLDDEKWPATRITEVLASEICGPVPPGSMARLEKRLYNTRSLIRGVQLGGNGGHTFKRRYTGRLGACRVDMRADGARWHTLTVTVRQ